MSGMQRLRLQLMVGLPVIAALVGLGFWLKGGRYSSTENAYVKADIAQVAAEVAGRVVEVRVRDHAVVQAGDVLMKLDPEPFRMALAKAEAELDQQRAVVENLRASWAEAQSELKEAQNKVAFYDQQQARQKALAARGVTATAKVEEADINAIAARDRVQVVESKIRRILTSLSNNPNVATDSHGLVREKLAARDRARLDLERSVITAPMGGIVVNVKIQPGEQVRAQMPLFSLVSDRRPWVEANFKETDLTHVRQGQKATVVLDIYPDVVWEAQVESISPATGAEFAILPPQNASGNWVKVVQRLPVRLRMMPRAGEPPLRAGMTATVHIDTERRRTFGSLFGMGSVAAPRQVEPAPVVRTPPMVRTLETAPPSSGRSASAVGE